MANLIFPAETTRTVMGVGGVGTPLTSVSGQTATIYLDSGGLTTATITAYPGGGAIVGSTLTIDTYGRLPFFFGPDTTTSVLYVKVGTGPVLPILARCVGTDDPTTKMVYQGVISGQNNAYVAPYSGGTAVVTEPHLNPMSRGAKFDGSTNDTAALQQSINDLHTAGVGKMLMPAGTSMFSNLVLRPKTTIEGMGTNVTLLSRITGSTGPAVTDALSQGATSIDLRSFTIECNNCTGNGLDIGFQSGGPDFNYWGTFRDFVVRDVAAGSIGMHVDADTIFASNVGIYSCGQGLVTGAHGANVWNFLHIVNSVAEDLVVNSQFDRFVGLTIERMQARASGGCISIPAGGGYAAFLGLTFDVEAAVTVLNMIDIASGGASFDVWGAGVNIPASAAITNLVNSEAWGVVTPGYTGVKSAILPEWHYHNGTGEPGPIWFDSSLGLHRELTGTRWSVSETAGSQYSARGVATLVAGTVVVTNHLVTATSRIHLAAQDNNTTGALRVSARTAGTSFTITSSNAADTGVVAYEINEKASY